MRRLLGILLTLACSCSGASSEDPEHTDLPDGLVVAGSKLQRRTDPALSADSAAAVAADRRGFALELYRELAREQGNLCFSPYSISIALAMTYAGAKTETASEMASTLHFRLPEQELHAAFNATDLDLARRKAQLAEDETRPEGDGFQLNLINAAWGQKDHAFLPSYLDVLALNYGASMYLADFTQAEASRRAINEWAAQHTQQRIEDLLPQGAIKPLTKLILTNAIYFKASWLEEFDPALTRSGAFTSPAGTRSVEMMHKTAFPAEYAERNGYQALSLPYLSRDVRMLLVLPPAGDFAAAAAGFDAQVLDALQSELSNQLVTLSLLKWTFESERALKAPLQTLGMNAAFGSSADFSGMDGDPNNLYIDEVYHKTFVAVDEEGTEAAASTAVVLRTRGILDPVSLTFDRPFIFLVYDDPTGQILFLGHLVDPG